MLLAKNRLLNIQVHMTTCIILLLHRVMIKYAKFTTSLDVSHNMIVTVGNNIIDVTTPLLLAAAFYRGDAGELSHV